MTSFWTYESTFVLVCPVRYRLSGVPPDLPRQRDRATAMPHNGPRYPRRKNGRRGIIYVGVVGWVGVERPVGWVGGWVGGLVGG